MRENKYIPMLFSVLGLIFGLSLLAEPKAYDPSDLRTILSKGGLFGRDWLRVTARSEELLNIWDSDPEFPSLHRVKNYFDLLIQEAKKTGQPILFLSNKDQRSQIGIEYHFGLPDPDSKATESIGGALLISPNRVKVIRLPNTNTVIIRVDGLDIAQRKTGTFRKDWISKDHIDKFFEYHTYVLREATSGNTLLKLNLGTGIWSGSQLTPVLEKTSKPALTDAQLKSNHIQQREERRQELLKELRKIDESFDSLDGGPAMDPNPDMPRRTTPEPTRGSNDITAYDATDIRIRVTKGTLSVIARREVVLSTSISKYIAPIPSLEHIKNFFNLKIGEAAKTNTPMLVAKKGSQDFWVLENFLGPQDPQFTFVRSIDRMLHVSPSRIKIYLEPKTTDLVMLIDGLEIIRRKRGTYRIFASDETIRITGTEINALYLKMLDLREKAIADGTLVSVVLTNSFWENSELKSPIVISLQPAPKDAQLRSEQARLLEKRRASVVKRLQKVDAELDALYENKNKREDFTFPRHSGKATRTNEK